MKKHHVVVIIWFIISIFGLAMSYSANYIDRISAGANVYAGLIEQALVIAVVGVAGIFAFFYIKFDWYGLIKKFSKLSLYITVGLLLLVNLVGAGRNGAVMVLDLGFFDLQPLEVFKITMILYAAVVFSDDKPDDTLKEIIFKLIVPFVGIGLIFIQPDLGGAMINIIVLFMIVVVNGQELKKILGITGGVIAGGLLIVPNVLHDYQLARIGMWINPFTDLQGNGNNLVQSFVAISNGGVMGSGYMNSIQKAGYLYASGSDFIFAVIAEELGLIGVLFTLSIIFAIALVAFSIGNTAHERFGTLYCYGFATLILTQAFINIGGVTGVIPMTGVTLPFISSGLNSYLFLSLGMFLMIPISQASEKERRRERKATNFKG